MKYVLYGLLGLIVLAVAAVLLGPGMIDWNAYKAEITAQLEKATGRALVIDGDIRLKIVPTPTFSATNVRLANVPGGSATDMAQVEALLVRVDLMPLIRSDVQVQTIELVKPVILLEVLGDGRRNWDFGGDGLAAAEAGTGAEPLRSDGQVGDLPVNVRLDNFTIRGGTLIYKDATDGIDERVDKVDVDLVAESLNGPFVLRGDALYRGIGGEVDLAVGRLKESGATPLRLGVSLPQADAEAKFSGALSRHPDSLTFRGKLSAEGSDLARAVAALAGQSASASAQLALPFALETELAGDQDEIAAQKIVMTLGENTASGEAALRLGETTEGKLAISIPRLDLDALQGRNGEAAAADGGQPAKAAGVLELPEDFAANIDVGIEALVYREQLVRQVALAARIENGGLKIDQAAALLPGGAAVSLSGGFDPEAQEPRFVGKVEAATSNLRSQLAWLGFDVEALPADRLRRMNLKSGLSLSAKQISLSDIDLTLDLSRIKGGMVVALRRRPAFGVGLAFDKLDLDAYLPFGLGTPPGSGDAEESDDVAEGGGFLERYDANLNLQVGELVARDLTYRDVALAGTLQQGKLDLKEARVGDLAGSRIEMSGSVAELTGDPLADLTFKLGIGDPGRLAKLAGLEPDTFAKFGPSELSGSVKGGLQALELDLGLNSLGGRLDLDGSLKPLEGPPGFDLEAKVKHGDLAFLLARFLDPRAEGQSLGHLALDAKLAGTAQSFRISELSGVLGPSDVSGDIAVDLAAERPKVTADLTTGRLPVAALFLGGAGSDGGTASGNGERWSREPIDLTALRSFDADLELKAEALIFDDLALETATVEAEVAGGVVNLKQLAGGLHGGELEVIGKADLRKEVELSAGISAVDVDIKPLLRRQLDFDRAAGPVTLNADLVSRGVSQHDLMSSLDGQGTLEGTVTVTARQEEQAAAALLDLLGKDLKQVQGIADASGLVLRAFAGAPAALSGSFVFEDGVATTRDTQLEGRGAVARLAGQADLGAWTTDFSTSVFEDGASDEADLILDVRGAMDRPNLRLRGAAFTRRSEPEPQSVPEPAPVILEVPDILPETVLDTEIETGPEDTPGSETEEVPETIAEPAEEPAPAAEEPTPEAAPQAPADVAAQPKWSAPQPGEEEAAPEAGTPESPTAQVPAPASKPAPPKPEDFINQILEGLKDLPKD